MASISSQPTLQSGVPSLVPHGRFKGKPAMPLGRPVTVIGSRTRSHLHLVSSQVSKSHAMVVNSGAGFYVRDLASRTHVFVNQQKVQEADLRDGDILAVGPFSFRFTEPKSGSRPRVHAVPDGVLRVAGRALPIDLNQRVLLIGRRSTCDLAIDEIEVSTTHAVIFDMDGKRFVRDLGSRTGTFVNGVLVHQQALEFGDTIRIGQTELAYAAAAGSLDELDDLAGTAQLPAEEPIDLVFDEPAPTPTPAPAVPAGPAPVAPTAKAVVPALPTASSPSPADELELALTPFPSEAKAETPRPIAPPPVAPVVPSSETVSEELTLTPFPDVLEPSASAGPAELGLSEPATESALGIELLPAGDADVVTPADEPVVAPSPGDDHDSGLDFAEPPTPAALVPEPPVVEAPVPMPEAEIDLDLEPLELDLAEEPLTSDAGKIETIEKTEPTPESAFGVEEVLPIADSGEAPTDVSPPVVDSLTDSVFQREVEAFEGPGLGPIVEPPAKADELPAPPAAEDVPLYGVDETPTEADPLIFEEVPKASLAAPVEPAPAAADAELPPPPPIEEVPVETEAAPVEVIPVDVTPVEETPVEPAEPIATEPAPVEEIPVEAAPAAEAPAEIALETEAPAVEAIEPEAPVAETTPKRRGRRPAATKAPKRTPKRKPPISAETEPAPESAPTAEGAAAAAAIAGVDAVLGTETVAGAEAQAEVASQTEIESEIDLSSAAESAPAEPQQAEATPTDLPAAELPAAELTPVESAPLELPVEPAIPEAADASAATDLPVAPESELEQAAAPVAAIPDVIEDVAPPAEQPVEPPAVVVSDVEAQPADFEIPVEPVIDERETADAMVDVAPSLPIPDEPAQVLELGDEPTLDESLAQDPLVFDESAASAAPASLDAVDELSSDPITEQAAASLTSSESVGAQLEVEPPTPAKPVDLFFGLQRDTASFLGGMPLELPPIQQSFGKSAAPPAGPAPADVQPPLPESSISSGPVESFRPARPAPPPPARSVVRERVRPPEERAPASPFDLNFDDVPTDRIEIPPFAGSGPATRGQVTTAFDGLAMPPVRETDVFSQSNTSGSAPTSFDDLSNASSAGDANDLENYGDEFGDEDQPTLDLSAADDADSASADPGAAAASETDTPAADEATARGGRSASAPARRPPAYPTEPATPRPKKKRWRIGKFWLLLLMIGCMTVASAGIWYAWPVYFPSTAPITARIKFAQREFDTLTKAQRVQVVADQRRKLETPEVRASAREILDKKYDGVSPGFLVETGNSQEVKAAARAYLDITENLKLVDSPPSIQILYKSHEGETDRTRLRALLEALHAVNKPMIDAAAGAAKAFEDKSQDLRLKTERLKSDINPVVETARQELGDQNALTEKSGIVDALQQKERQLLAEWSETTSRVKAMTAQLKSAESDVPVDPNADPSKRAAVPEEDVQVAQLTSKIEELTANLEKKKQQRAARSDDARKGLATSLKQFEDDIAKARGSMKEDSELGRYLESAARIQAQLKDVSGELAQQQRSGMERLTMLKSKLAAKNEARIRQAFATDPDLQAIQENLALKERQFNTAKAGGLKDDARAIEKEIKGLKLEIESRQDLLTTANGIAPDKDLEDFINDTLKSMESDRARNDRRMADMLKDLASQAPAAGSLPAEQKEFAEQLEKRQAELNAARQRYAAAADAAVAEADEEVKELETELAAAQVKVDERKKQVADAARKTMSADEQRDQSVATDRQKRELERAQKADQAAADAYWANRRALTDSTDELARLKKRAETFERESKRAMAMQKEIQGLSDEVEKLRLRRDASVVPLAPAEEDVSNVADLIDRRIPYMLGTDLLLAVIFVILIVISSAHASYPPDEEYDEIPYAGAVPDDDEHALAAAVIVEQATEKAHRGRHEATAVA